MSVKLIDCHTGTAIQYSTINSAITAAYKLETKTKSNGDWEIHNARGECLAWKMPGNATFIKT